MACSDQISSCRSRSTQSVTRNLWVRSNQTANKETVERTSAYRDSTLASGHSGSSNKAVVAYVIVRFVPPLAIQQLYIPQIKGVAKTLMIFYSATGLIATTCPYFLPIHLNFLKQLWLGARVGALLYILSYCLRIFAYI
jgi:hypothetical protein